jgi:ribosomal protein L11 methyltransferase
MPAMAADTHDILHTVTIRAPGPVCATLAELLEIRGHNPSVWLGPDKQSGTVTLYYSSAEHARREQQALVAYLEKLDSVVAAGDYEIVAGQIEREEWADAWKQYFHTARVSERLVVTPEWEPYKALPGDVVVTISPGMAFGTGLHGTTKACLTFLDWITRDYPVASMLDIGSGSGILSIAAAKLGLEAIDAFDHDTEAVTTTERNCRENHIAHRVHVFEADLRTFEPAHRYDIVAGNLLCTLLVHNADLLAACVAPGGHLLLSGILAEQYTLAETTFGERGFAEQQRLTIEGWTSGWFARPG